MSDDAIKLRFPGLSLTAPNVDARIERRRTSLVCSTANATAVRFARGGSSQNES